LKPQIKAYFIGIIKPQQNRRMGRAHHKITNYKFNWDSFWGIDFSQRYSKTIDLFQLAKANSPYAFFLIIKGRALLEQL